MIQKLLMQAGESGRPLIMGILNVTPDSFYDGGRYFDKKLAIERAVEMVEEGADLIDVGGESSRPGADTLTEKEELKRVIPVLCPYQSIRIRRMWLSVPLKPVQLLSMTYRLYGLIPAW